MALPAEGVVILGPKVALREKTNEDAWNDYLWRVDEELSELDAARPLNLSFVEFAPIYREELRYPTPRSHRFAIVDLDGKHIGNCMYYDLDLRRREAELGIMIGDRAYWNHGYGEDSVNLLLDFMFERLNLRRVYLQTLDWNLRAQKCFTKCGFRQYSWGERSRYRFMLMEIHRETWQELRQKRQEAAASATEPQQPTA